MATIGDGKGNPKKSLRQRFKETTPGKALGYGTLVGLLGTGIVAASTEVFKVAANAFAKPPLEKIANALYLDKGGTEWIGLYRSPILVDRGTRPREQEDVRTVDHEPGTQTWKLNFVEKDRVIADVVEDGHHFDIIGLLKDDSIVASMRGKDKGRGTLYLTKNSSHDYYSGVILLCDCQSPTAHAMMVCPYILYDNSDSAQRAFAKRDPVIGAEKKCASIEAENLQSQASANVIAQSVSPVASAPAPSSTETARK